jgi:hypothetical protein
MDAFEDRMRRGGARALAEAGRFFMKDDPVHQSLRKIAARLSELSIPYAVAGGMALVAHGYDRTTVDVDVLVDQAGLDAAHRALEGLVTFHPSQEARISGIRRPAYASSFSLPARRWETEARCFSESIRHRR